jgi:prophage antirepressor-like protein
MSNLTTFDFNSLPVRVVEQDGEPWFVATDVCKVLGLSNPTLAVRPLGSEEKTLNQIKTVRGVKAVNCISESGLYKLVMKVGYKAA